STAEFKVVTPSSIAIAFSSHPELQCTNLRQRVVNVVERRFIDVPLLLPNCASLEERVAVVIAVGQIPLLELTPTPLPFSWRHRGLIVHVVLKLINEHGIREEQQRTAQMLELVLVFIFAEEA